MNIPKLVILFDSSIPLQGPRLMELVVSNPATPANIVVRTPAVEHHFAVSFLNIPWFSFQDKVLDSGFWGARHVNERPALELSTSMLIEIEKVAYGQLEGSTGDILRGHSRDGLPSAAQLYSQVTGTQEEDQIPSRQYSWILSRVLTGFDLVRAIVFLSSNNKFFDWQMEKFLQWIQDINGEWILKAVLSTQTLTSEIFTSNLLISASKIRNLETLRSLLKLKTDATIRKKLLRTAMMEATKDGNVSLVEILLDGGAGANDLLGYTSDFTPLSLAIDSENYELTYLLLNTEAPVDQWSCYHGTALQIAAAKDNTAVVRILMDKGFNLDAPSGMSIPCETPKSCRQQRSRALISPLVHAVRNGNIELVKTLLGRGADINLCPGHQYKRFFFDLLEDRGEETDVVELRREFIIQTMRTALETAVYQENLELVKYLLNAGARADQHQCGNSALAIAAERGNVTLTKLLLVHGAELHGPTSCPFGRTAVQAASMNGNMILLEMLLSSITDVLTGLATINAPPSPHSGRTALQAAAEQGHIRVMRYLLALGADIKGPVAKTGGLSTLQAAVRSRSLDVVSFVLAAGADTSTPPGTISALNFAINQSNLPMLLLLLEHDLDVNARPVDRGETPLQAAIDDSKALTLTFLDNLIRAGADVNANWSFTDYSTALQKACDRHAHGYWTTLRNPFQEQQADDCDGLEVVQLLLQAGADANGPVEYVRGVPRDIVAGEIPIQTAAFAHHARLMDLLLQYGADPNATHGKEGCSALASAMRRLSKYDHGYQSQRQLRSVETVQLLLKAGAHANGRSYGTYEFEDHAHLQTSILGSAAQYMQPEVVRTMLASGADPNWRYSLDDTTALERAMLSEYEEIIHMILEAGADINAPAASVEHGRTALQQAASVGKMHIVRLLLQKGADVNAPASLKDGRTALQQAASRGETHIVRLLLQKGADVNAPASLKDGRTALQQAASRGETHIVRLLLQKGADVNAPPSQVRGVTALQAASIQGHLATAILLLHAGADINAEASAVEGRTALEGAAEMGRLDIVHLLLDNDHDLEGFYDRCENAADYADDEGHSVIARLLWEYQKD